MASERLSPEQVDRLYAWPVGLAARLARRKRLPHYLLPDGSIRFDRAEIELLIIHVPAQITDEGRGRHGD